MYFELSDLFVVRADLARTWEFFSDAANLPVITPPSLGFRILTPGAIEMREGMILDYTIRLMGLPVRWRTRIIDWTPRRQFIDVQIRGPYAFWHHQHVFAETPDGVECRDRVLYKVPWGIVGDVVNALVIGRQLLEIFRFRRQVIGQRLGWVGAVQNDVEIRKMN